MDKFNFRAFDEYGKLNKGSVEAISPQLAMEQLKARNLWVVKLINHSESIWQRDINLGGPRVNTERFTVFCRQLSTMYESGVSMVDAIEVLSRQTGSKSFNEVLSTVAAEMRKGQQFSEVAAEFPTVFSIIFVNMIRAGEVSGKLDEMLNRLAIFHEKEHSIREKVKSAMIYPIIMSIVMICVVIFIMMFVIPSYISNFESMGITLPLPTLIVIHISEFVQNFWYLIIAFILIPSTLLMFMKRSVKGRHVLDYTKLRIPIFGNLAHKQAISRFSRTFSSLYEAGIPLMRTMSILSRVTGNEVLGKLIHASVEQLRNGQSIVEPFRNSWLFPPMVVQMLAIGEQTGELDVMTGKVADFYEADVDAMADRLKSLLEPMMILVLAVVVGGIVLAVLMPSFAMMENM